ncbi:MAG: hypothetical protein ACT4OM_09580 [Actinomycetota bacterium]
MVVAGRAVDVVLAPTVDAAGRVVVVGLVVVVGALDVVVVGVGLVVVVGAVDVVVLAGGGLWVAATRVILGAGLVLSSGLFHSPMHVVSQPAYV